MKSTITKRWAEWDGTERVREFNAVIDIRDFEGTPGYASLVIAANATNPRVTALDISLFLGTGKNERPVSWIRKRRWLFQQPGTSNNHGRVPDLDGKQGLAVEVMRANSKLSLRDLALVLKEHGVPRGREWIRKHRCD